MREREIILCLFKVSSFAFKRVGIDFCVKDIKTSLMHIMWCEIRKMLMKFVFVCFWKLIFRRLL